MMASSARYGENKFITKIRPLTRFWIRILVKLKSLGLRSSKVKIVVLLKTVEEKKKLRRKRLKNYHKMYHRAWINYFTVLRQPTVILHMP